MLPPPNLQDALQRQRALDPSQSFIVQAPAGSGKTELLVQRYLSLLARVRFPEAIIAITFTRKAAHEMRLRIMNALEAANQTHSFSLQETPRYLLAKKVLKQDERLGWNLLANPNRLRIQTIDSLCQSLARQMPLLSTLAEKVTPVENPEWLYRLATQELLSHLENKSPWQNALMGLLAHLDNNFSQVETLLSHMLARREQWLDHLMDHPHHLRDYLEQGLQRINQEIVATLNQLISPHLSQELHQLVNFSCYQREKKPLDKSRDLVFWQEAASLLLTQSQEWRKQVGPRQGFPSAHTLKDKVEKKQAAAMKKRVIAIIRHISQQDALKEAFIALKQAPPLHYTDTQWKVLSALFELLPVLAAHLKVVFQEQEKVDYTEILLCALAALGQPENPTDLALSLDYQIEHLLVDEFQDTSRTQFQLIKKLTAHWQENEGKSLFLVGDPMQSIYRFRKAEVGLFSQVQRYGIGNIRLHPLTLSINFRSNSALVEWINKSFSRLLPQEATHRGAIPFSPATAFLQGTTEKAVTSYWLSDTNPLIEANQVVAIIQNIKREEIHSSIAILVRARTHLSAILPALTTAAIPYQAIEIDSLAEKSAVQDLLALTRALLHLGDKIGWLALLRSPYCGLCLHDLHQITQWADKNSPPTTLWQSLNQFASLPLSDDAKQRLRRIVPILQDSLSQQGRIPLIRWIKETWVNLGGPTTLQNPQEISYIDSFLSYLEKKVSYEGDAMDSFELEADLAKIYVQSDAQQADAVDIMTIHKAKGLEYDHVILPGLHRKGSIEKAQLLLYSEEQLANQTSALLLGPIKASHEKEDLIYQYLFHEEKKKRHYELTRLLYVASTRPKKSLHLLGALTFNEKGDIKAPPYESLLSHLWPIIKMTIDKAPLPPTHFNPTKPHQTHRLLKRLTPNWKRLVSVTTTHDRLLPNQTFAYQWTLNPARTIGVLIHRLLYQISQDGLDAWDEKKMSAEHSIFYPLLAQYQLLLSQQQDALVKLKTAVQKTLADPRGRWILSQHQEAHSEFSLTAILNGKIQNLVVDRTFIDSSSGIRWIIDYKTTVAQDNAFYNPLNNEMQQYKEQLEKYAAAFSLDSNYKGDHTIRLGLYFPLTSFWYEWAFAEEPQCLA